MFFNASTGTGDGVIDISCAGWAEWRDLRRSDRLTSCDAGMHFHTGEYFSIRQRGASWITRIYTDVVERFPPSQFEHTLYTALYAITEYVRLPTYLSKKLNTHMTRCIFKELCW